MIVTAVDTEEEVESEGAFLDLGTEVSIRDRDEAGVDGAGFVTADAGEGAILKNLQELRLDAHVETADLVEEEGALVGLLDAAELGGACAREGALFHSRRARFRAGSEESRGSSP